MSYYRVASENQKLDYYNQNTPIKTKCSAPVYMDLKVFKNICIQMYTCKHLSVWLGTLENQPSCLQGERPTYTYMHKELYDF